ncbi:hypothetical protein V491_05651 [Pseudogymnoascus sp. VKM F-3775]|nr:hypothetical protein V491_05651 [Pseudogymnoascus sp. VKM F-3775]
MKLFYVLALLTATALAAPTEVESSQVLGKRECVPPSSTALNQSAFVTHTTTVTATATATTANSASLLWVLHAAKLKGGRCAPGEKSRHEANAGFVGACGFWGRFLAIE